jgi:hypothetical protein
MDNKQNQPKRKKKRKRKRKPRDAGFGRCIVCNAPLFEQGGFAESGMCGPCCTGEAATYGPPGWSE